MSERRRHDIEVVGNVLLGKTTGTIVSADVNVASPVSRQYLVSLMVGRNVMGDLAEISKEIEHDYHSTSQKAILQALHDLSISSTTWITLDR
ncbi:MAG: DUF3870 domain-containing protein [Aeromicrobium sp.]